MQIPIASVLHGISCGYESEKSNDDASPLKLVSGLVSGTKTDINTIFEEKNCMNEINEQEQWEMLSYEEKNHQLFLKQKSLLETFLEKGAISKEQFEKSLHDLKLKMGY